MKINLSVPYGLRFDDLAIHRTPAGEVVFDRAALRAICVASGMTPDALEAPRFKVLLPLVLHGWLEVTKVTEEPVSDAEGCAALVGEMVASAMAATPDPEPFVLQLRPMPRDSVVLH